MDTILFSNERFVNTTLVVPYVLSGTTYGILQVLISKAVLLEEVNIYSLPSEEKFKEEFKSLELQPNMEQRAVNAQKSLRSTLKDAYQNEKYYYDIWANRSIYELSNEIPPNQLLDPIKCSQFIDNFKDEQKKKK